MTLAIAGLGAPELLIILAVVLLLFGGSRLAGLGKSTGRALKEFKEETKGLKSDHRGDAEITGTTTPVAGTNTSPYADPSQVQQPAPSTRPMTNPVDPDVRRDV